MEQQVADKILDQAAPTAPTTETTPAVDQVKPDDISRRLDLLAKQERKLLEEKKQMKAEREKMLQEAEEKLNPYKKYQSIEERLKNKDYSALNELNFDYEDYTRTRLNDGDPTPQTLIQKAIQDLEKKLDEKLSSKEEERVRMQKDLYEKQQQALKGQWNNEIKDYLLKDETKSKYPFLVSQPDFNQVVLNLIEQSWEKSKKKLTIDDAAEMANKYYFDNEKQRIMTNKDSLKDVFLESLGIDKEKFDIFYKSLNTEHKIQPKTEVKTLSNTQTTLANSEAKSRMTREQSLEAVSKLIKNQ